MALTIKNLGLGSLPSTAGTILAGSTSKSTLVKSISLVNTSASAVSVNIWLAVAQGTINATQRLVSPSNLQIAPNAQIVLDTELTLFTTNGGSPSTAIADKLVAAASVANVVDYVINGLERDV
jgi:hypothetical protein